MCATDNEYHRFILESIKNKKQGDPLQASPQQSGLAYDLAILLLDKTFQPKNEETTAQMCARLHAEFCTFYREIQKQVEEKTSE